ncbi:TPA: DUF1294 domain-containing protein [Patescibacteria group bacterium]|nr:PF06961 family protein [candidate division SR1 bacterium RAAC1_SR1_1]HCY20889.1 DUF1294 domain-containing protein [Candidatus Gracilibacteria bacterium]
MTRVYILLIYFVLINVVTFVVRGVDKWKAQHQKWRIKERTLLGFAGAGGWLGSLAAMEFLRHKTVKGKFLLWFWLWTSLWIIAILTALILFI